jgi:hypothetical protein
MRQAASYGIIEYLMLIFIMNQHGFGETDFWDLAPIYYSEIEPNNPLSKLAADLSSGVKKSKEQQLSND